MGNTTAEIEAESRDAAFAKVRSELGIKPIKVVAAEDGSGKSAASPNSSARTQLSGAGGSRSRATVWGAAILAAILLVVLGGVVWWMRSPNRESPATNQESPTANGELPTVNDDQPITIAASQGPVTLHIATPLPRQMIPGDRKRIADAASAFKYPAEAWLARYAEPGRQLPATIETPPAVPAASHPTRPAPADFEAALREPIRIASTDFTEVVDLKRIVTGMKREMKAYLAGGGTIGQYLLELNKRQRLEISYRENAEKRLQGMLPKPKEAYAYWLKANASLKSMGIYELPLPDALHGYQAGLGLDE